MRVKATAVLILIIVWGIAAFTMVKSLSKLTYLEYVYDTEISEDSVELKNEADVIEQEFVPAYDILHGVAVKIGTFNRDNNSLWKIEIISKDTNKVIYSKQYNASLIEDNSFHLFEFDKNLRVDKEEIYVLRISPDKVNENTCISFYVGSGSDKNGMVLNGIPGEKSLCFAEYGGDTDYWWISYCFVIALIISAAVLRGCSLASNSRKLLSDKLLGGMLVFFLVLLLLNSFSVAGAFTDEFDNIRGGMIIARGGVLYKDYVTQHTPVMYYLCGFFALLGAGSVEQFRLSYYLLEALIWGLLYIRHEQFFGKKKMLILPVLECMFVSSVLGNYQGYMVLSDGMQGLCTVALLLEFIRYYNDRKIDWSRSAVVSLTVCGSIGSAFISVYAIVIAAISFICLEVRWNIKNHSRIKDILKRYYAFLISLSIPFVASVVYFKMNNALKLAFEQAYVFNREVYSNYTSIGDNIFEPFIKSEQNFFGIIADDLMAIINSSANTAVVLQLVIVVISTAVIVSMCIKKRFIESITLFLVMMFSGSRGYGFHGIAAWFVAIMIIALFGEPLLRSGFKRFAVPFCAVLGIFMVSIFARAAGDNLLYEQRPVSEMESWIISNTKDGEKVLIDAYCCDSVYLLYKDRYPANRLCYMLAWYMDWYEQDTIDDLINNDPEIVIYAPDITVWEYQYYSNAFRNELEKNYTQLSQETEDDWKSYIWIRN